MIRYLGHGAHDRRTRTPPRISANLLGLQVAGSVVRMSEVVVLGSGFAGLWAALGAARRLDELGAARGEVTVTVISSQPYHDIRVRNYEADLTDCRIALSEVLDPAGIGQHAANVTAVDSASHTVATTLGTHAYDRLVVALGSQEDGRAPDPRSA